MKREALIDSIAPYKRTKIMVEIENYGQERVLPSFKQNRPNADYFNLNLGVRIYECRQPNTEGMIQSLPV